MGLSSNFLRKLHMNRELVLALQMPDDSGTPLMSEKLKKLVSISVFFVPLLLFACRSAVIAEDARLPSISPQTSHCVWLRNDDGAATTGERN